MKILFMLSSAALGLSIAAVIMAEFGFSSLVGDWRPTHQTAIAYGVISIACTAAAIHIQLGDSKD